MQPPVIPPRKSTDFCIKIRFSCCLQDFRFFNPGNRIGIIDCRTHIIGALYDRLIAMRRPSLSSSSSHGSSCGHQLATSRSNGTLLPVIAHLLLLSSRWRARAAPPIKQHPDQICFGTTCVDHVSLPIPSSVLATPVTALWEALLPRRRRRPRFAR